MRKSQRQCGDNKDGNKKINHFQLQTGNFSCFSNKKKVDRSYPLKRVLPYPLKRVVPYPLKRVVPYPLKRG
jgi:hypothetical protein